MATDNLNQDGVRCFKLHTRESQFTTIPSGPAVRLADLVYQTSLGVNTVLGLFEKDISRECADEPKVLNGYERGALLMLAKSSMLLLAEQSADFARWVDEEHTEAGKTMKRNQAKMLLGYPVEPAVAGAPAGTPK